MKSNHADNIARTAPIAMHAVARHMLDYSLPAPASIDAPIPCMARNIRIGVHSNAVDAWLETIVIDDEQTKPANRPGYVHNIYVGRLPNGVRVELITTRRTPELHAVTA